MSFLENYTLQVSKGLWLQDGVDPIVHCALKLAGEAGEIADAVGKTQYNPPKQYTDQEMLFELGDAQWYLTNLARLHEFTLKDVMEGNIFKLQNRHPTKGVYDVKLL